MSVTTSTTTGRFMAMARLSASRKSPGCVTRMPAHPKAGMIFRLEGGYKTGAADHTEVLSVGKEQVEVPYGSDDWLAREVLKGVGDLVVLEPTEAREAVLKAVA